MTPEHLKLGERLAARAQAGLDQVVAAHRKDLLILGNVEAQTEFRKIQDELLAHANVCASPRCKLLGLMAVMAEIGISYSAIELQRSTAQEHGQVPNE
jgi:hypothetical protein